MKNVIRVKNDRKYNMKISIIVPVYNTKKEYLKKCVDSLLNQTMKEIEVILIDDGSTNQAGKICDEYVGVDNRVKVLHQKNQGVAVARNNGLDIAEGEWITFVDADDWCENTMCEEILRKAVENSSEILIFTNYSVQSEKTVKKNQFFAKDIKKFDEKMKEEAELKTMLRTHPSFSFQPPINMMGGTWCKLINRNFLEKSGVKFEPELLRSQDIIFYLNLFEKADDISYYNRQLYYYRYDENSVSRRYRKDAYKIFLKVLNKQYKFILENHKPEIFYEVFTKGVMNTIGICMNTDFVHEKNNESFRNKTIRIRKMIRQEPICTVLKNPISNGLLWTQVLQKKLLKWNWVEIYIILWKINERIKK